MLGIFAGPEQLVVRDYLRNDCTTPPFPRHETADISVTIETIEAKLNNR
jgi:hypothetical protein